MNSIPRRSDRLAAKAIKPIVTVPATLAAKPMEDKAIQTEPMYDSDDGYSSDATEYCLVRAGLKKKYGFASHHNIVQCFKNDRWFTIAYG